MANQQAKGVRRIINAWFYSINGFKAAFREEEAIRQETLLAVVLIPLGFFLGQTAVEQVLLVMSVLFLLLVELLNSAIEATIDRFGGEHHELSGRAKDIGSAAVFVAIVMMSVTWGMILYSYL